MTTTKSGPGKQTTPPKGRPTPRRNHTKASNAASSSPARDADTRVRRTLGLAACIAVAFAHIAATVFVVVQVGGDTSTLLACLAVPAVVTAFFVPHARRHGWHRWLCLVGLAFVVFSDALVPVLVTAEAWILHRFWVVEREEPIARRQEKNGR